MARPLAFRRLFHSDWSRDPKKRWTARATRAESGWIVDAPQLTAPSSLFIDSLFEGGVPTLAGFDFPIGLPEAYGRQTGFMNFPEALRAFGEGEWSDFFRVSEAPGEICIRRPFYPQIPHRGVAHRELFEGLKCRSMNDLYRSCERRTSARNAACPLFWTVGGNQVGKAAINGWQEMIVPAVARGAKLWPFEGRLANVASGVVLAETYPAEAYGHVGFQFVPRESKRRQADRQRVATYIVAWAVRNHVMLSDEVLSAIEEGFGSEPSGEDPFDSLIGLLGMIDVVEERRAEGPTNLTRYRQWEGWILGQIDSEKSWFVV